MVEYTKWVSLVWEQVDSDKVEATEVTKFAAKEWNRNKEGLQRANVGEARTHAKNVVR